MKENEKIGRGGIKLLYITTVPETIRAFLMGGHIDFMKSSGFEVICVSSPGEELDDVGKRNDVDLFGVRMTRGITPVVDIKALLSLYLLFRRVRPDIVNMSTPKASLLGSIAAWAARVPVWIYMNRGTIFVNYRGPKRFFFKTMERLTSALCHLTIFVSRSQMEFAEEEGTIREGKGILPLSGACEIDTARFDPDRDEVVKTAAILRERLDLEGSTVIGYVGRLEADKGIVELSRVWELLREKYPKARLLIVGRWDADKMNDTVANVRERLERDDRVIFTGQVEDVVPYYSMMDILLFPSHREGFPYAPMEAAAMRVPAVATSVMGCVDAVVDGETGILVPRGDIDSLSISVGRLIEDPDLRRRLGEAGRKRCVRDFSPERIRRALADEYIRLLKTNAGKNRLKNIR